MPTFQIPLMDGKLPEISVLDSECLMAEEFGTLFALVEVLALWNGVAPFALSTPRLPAHLVIAGENRQDTGIAIQVVMGDFAAGKKSNQRYIAQSMAHNLQLSTGAAKMGTTPA